MSSFVALPESSPASRLASSVDPQANQTLKNLFRYCQERRWSGYDPYDALNSRLFQATPFKRFRLPRIALIQLMKRCPVNLRPLLLVPTGQNPKGIALFLQASLALEVSGISTRSVTLELADSLLAHRSRDPGGAAWGYNFHWQTRYYLVPRGTPNIICTTFAGQALLDLFEATGNLRWLDAARRAAEFLLHGLNRYEDGDALCFSYTPLDQSRIHNANLLGAALLARLHSLEPNRRFHDAALKATRYSIKRQACDGSWIYGEGPKQQWIDSFHTGYNLLALRSIANAVPQFSEAADSWRKGLAYFAGTFFNPDGSVKYFHDRSYPYDIHAVAVAILTCLRFRDVLPNAFDLSISALRWAQANLQHPDGWFYYQKKKRHTIKIPYIRWSQAWMLLALAKMNEVAADSTNARLSAAALFPSEVTL